MKNNTVVVSGGFDPLHIGHVRLFKQASKMGDLIVILNSDKFLIRKKGYAFMPLEERMELVAAIRYVDKVVAAIDKDQTVCETLTMLNKEYAPMYFVNGGDRTVTTTPETETCLRLGIKPIYGIVGTLGSSSDLVKNAWQKVVGDSMSWFGGLLG